MRFLSDLHSSRGSLNIKLLVFMSIILPIKGLIVIFDKLVREIFD